MVPSPPFKSSSYTMNKWDTFFVAYQIYNYPYKVKLPTNTLIYSYILLTSLHTSRIHHLPQTPYGIHIHAPMKWMVYKLQSQSYSFHHKCFKNSRLACQLSPIHILRFYAHLVDHNPHLKVASINKEQRVPQYTFLMLLPICPNGDIKIVKVCKCSK